MAKKATTKKVKDAIKIEDVATESANDLNIITSNEEWRDQFKADSEARAKASFEAELAASVETVEQIDAPTVGTGDGENEDGNVGDDESNKAKTEE